MVQRNFECEIKTGYANIVIDLPVHNPNLVILECGITNGLIAEKCLYVNLNMFKVNSMLIVN